MFSRPCRLTHDPCGISQCWYRVAIVVPQDATAAQIRVRQEAAEMQDFLTDLHHWELSAKEKDVQMKAKAAAEARKRKVVYGSESGASAAATPSSAASPPVRMPALPLSVTTP